MIPVAGFLANGVAYVSGQKEVGRSFESVKQAAGLADASREFNGAVAAMGNAARDFVGNGRRDQIATYQAANATAMERLKAIAARTEGDGAKDIPRFERMIQRLQSNFQELLAERERLGFTESDGLQATLSRGRRDGGSRHRKAMTWLLPVDAQAACRSSLAQMRRHEARYMARRDADSRDAVGYEADKWNEILDQTIGSDGQKAELKQAIAGLQERLFAMGGRQRQRRRPPGGHRIRHHTSDAHRR